MDILWVLFILFCIILLLNGRSNANSTSYKIGRGLGAKVKKIMDEGDNK